MIDSLQEQVNNAKDKLLRLMSASQPGEDQDMNSSNTNLNSSSTQTTELQSDDLCAYSLPQRDPKSQLSPPLPSPHLTAAAASISPSDEPLSAQNCSPATVDSTPVPGDMCTSEKQSSPSITSLTGRDMVGSRPGENLKQPFSHQPSGLLRTSEETVKFVTSLQSRRGLNPFQIDTSGNQQCLEQNSRHTGFVSSEQLQEILQDLSIDPVETSFRSAGQMSRTPTRLKRPEVSTFSPLSLQTPRSPHPPVLFRYPSISPYVMRKRRPPFYSSRSGLACFYRGPEAVACGRLRNKCEQQNTGKHPDGVVLSGTLIRAHNNDLQPEEEEEDMGGNEVIRKCQKDVSKSHRCSVLPCAKHNYTATPDVEAGTDNEHHSRHRDSCWSWDSESSSSTDYCYYHRPYCDSCLQRGSLMSSDSSSDSSDSEYEGYASMYRSTQPVVFKDNIKPTYV